MHVRKKAKLSAPPMGQTISKSFVWTRGGDGAHAGVAELGAPREKQRAQPGAVRGEREQRGEEESARDDAPLPSSICQVTPGDEGEHHADGRGGGEESRLREREAPVEVQQRDEEHGRGDEQGAGGLRGDAEREHDPGAGRDARHALTSVRGS